MFGHDLVLSCNLMLIVHVGSAFQSLSAVSFLRSRKRNLGTNVSSWMAVCL